MSSVSEFKKEICFHCDRIVFAERIGKLAMTDCNSHQHVDCSKKAYICKRLALRIIENSTSNTISDKSIAIIDKDLVTVIETLPMKAYLIEEQEQITCTCGAILTSCNIKSSTGGLPYESCLIM